MVINILSNDLKVVNMNLHIKKTIGFLHQKKIDIATAKKMKLIKKNIPKLVVNKPLESEYIKLWERLFKKPNVLFNRILTTVNGIESAKYVPENIHYGIIEPILNNRAYALIYNDKNFFERYLPDFKYLFPKSVLRSIGGVLYDADYKTLTREQSFGLLNELSVNDYFILKPASETGGGDDVLLIHRVEKGFTLNNDILNTEEFLQFLRVNYKNNFIFQHRLNQLRWFHDFNESSLNTIRIYTYRSVKDEMVHPLHAYVRFGKEGSLVDSSSQGGRTCGISRNGILNNYALGKYGEKYTDLVCIKDKKNKTVPHFLEMKEIAKEIAKSYYYHRLLGFDFCVDKDNNIRLLEVNNLYVGVINQQMNSGPLFGEFTDEVIEYCNKNKHKKSFVLSFKH